MQGTILIAEDDSASRELLSRLLTQAGHAVVPSVDGEDALRKLNSDTAVAIVDLRMPRLSGYDCIEEIKKRNPETPIIVVSSAGTKDAVQAMQNGAFSFLQKPYDRKEILESVREAFLVREKRVRDREVHSPLKAILPADAPVKFEHRIITQLKELKPSGEPVLLIGEEGTKTGEVARYIHQQFKEGEGSYVEVDFRTILVESAWTTLFGTEEKEGRVSLANGGTLVIKSPELTPRHVQKPLLDVCSLKTQLIAISTVDLSTLESGRVLDEEFQKHLSKRTVTIPPLRERRASILNLVASFLERLQRVPAFRGTSKFEIEEEALNALIEYDWPGNEQQLHRVLESAAYLCNDSNIRKSDLHFEQTETSSSAAVLEELSQKPLREIENFFIRKQLQRHGGNKSKAARSLGITDRTIFNRVQKYGLDS